jgi:RNA polymerase sigma-70 factor (ECF subfamily)
MFIRFKRKPAPNDLHDLPDHELILKYRETRNAEVIAILFQRYTHLVYGVCLKYLADQDDAKDAVMEIFEGLIDDLLKHEVHNFKSWLHSVTRNHCLMKLRKEKAMVMDIEKMTERTGEDFVEIADDLHQEDVLENYNPGDLSEVLKTLKEPQRRCIELFYLEGKSYQEVSDITGYSMNEVKSYVQNGKRNLKLKLEANHVRKS